MLGDRFVFRQLKIRVKNLNNQNLYNPDCRSVGSVMVMMIQAIEIRG